MLFSADIIINLPGCRLYSIYLAIATLWLKINTRIAGMFAMHSLLTMIMQAH